MEAGRELSNSPRLQKKRKLDENAGTTEGVYTFKVLLPNGTSVTVDFDPDRGTSQMSIDHLVQAVRGEYKVAFRRTTNSPTPKSKRRDINWTSDQLYFQDSQDRVIKTRIRFSDFDPLALNILRLYDGCETVPDTYENMWDLTPDTDLLTELPEEYSFESALAELIDNSLQAVWTNDVNEKRLISVEVEKSKISVFDTGPGMDASEQYSIVKWGKMGASLHRSYKYQTNRGHLKPPYLLPFFGMFGYGGPIASMHLGRRALVSSKRKDSKQVYALNLEREALLRNSGSGRTWKTDGGMRDALENDIQKSPHGSFTKVEIYKLKMKSLNISELQWKLKDIYFPYIQCDELSSGHQTTIPVEFEVNGLNLTEVEGGESAITNWFSCNGPDFVFQIRIQVKRGNGSTKKAGRQIVEEANARLKCVYFPFTKGKESINKILEKLNSEEVRINEDFTSFSRVSIRRLGRLLPDARWPWLPFMDLRQKKGENAPILKICCMRVKCFIDTDGGFNPTRSKTDLVYRHAFTTVLKNFGGKYPEKDPEANVDILVNEKKVCMSQLQKEYMEWICKMHDTYDEENECGEDQPVIVVTPIKRRLLVSSDVVRVHREIRKNGKLWKSGQKIKILKGTCAGCHDSNVYATLELIVLGGLEGDSGGESRLICRPIKLRDDEGCVLSVKDGVPSLDMRRALSVPLNAIDSGKVLALTTKEWNIKLAQLNEKTPNMIEMLSAHDCQELDIDGAFPLGAAIFAGQAPPGELVAVIRPKSFTPSASNSLEQKNIIIDGPEMSMEVKFLALGEEVSSSHHLYSIRRCSSKRRGVDGLYIFPLLSKMPNIFTKAGRYMFSFFIKNLDIKSFEAKVNVMPSPGAKKWNILSKFEYPWKLRMGRCHLDFDLVCYDEYTNRIPFSCLPKVDMMLNLEGYVSCRMNVEKMDLSHDKLIIHFEAFTIESNELDRIRPHYEANIVLSSPDAPCSVTVPCQVTPGPIQNIEIFPTNFGDKLYPGCVIQQLELEFFDAYGNHALGGSVAVILYGFTFQDNFGSTREIDEHGCLNLSGILKVTAGHGQTVSISLISESEVLRKMVFQTKRRNLKLVSELPEHCYTGMQLRDVKFKVLNDEGDVDTTIHNEDPQIQSHMLLVNTDASDYQFSEYAFEHGCCTVPELSLPQKEGSCCVTATHSSYPDIHLCVEVQVIQVPSIESDDINCVSPDGKFPLLVQATMNTIHAKEKALYGAILEHGKDIGVIEEELNNLQIEKKEIEQDMLALQGLELKSLDHLNSSLKTKQLMDIIETKSESAAPLVCNLLTRESLEEPLKSFMADVVGIVSQLGAVQSEQLSRVLAEYVSENQMLAIVCRTSDGASALRKCQEVNAAAAALGNPVLRRFDVICLEEIRPFVGGYICGDYQMTLDLRNPMLENGASPAGFLGYAVNLVHIDIAHMHLKTSSGHGLRETLFYRLFGELQVYETVDHMNQALACGYLKQNAVSIDGGIARGNGVFSYGFRNPEVCFPVLSLDYPHLSQEEQETLKRMQEKRMELVCKHKRIGWLNDVHRKAKKVFDRKYMQYKEFLDENALLLECNIGSSSCISG